MTLFKKVFQNQSQPASSEDVLDEDALRKAFTDAENTVDPLQLDPFEYVEEKAEAESFEEEMLDFQDADVKDDEVDTLDDAGGFQMVDADFTQEEYTDEAISEDRSSFDPHEVADLNDELEMNEDDMGQSDEEIAACLDRALAAETPEVEPEGSELDAALEQETDPEELDADGEYSEAESFEVEDSSGDNVDLTQFAQQQMAALETDEETASTDASSMSEPSLDLSDATGSGIDAVPAPAAGRAGRRVGRVKTRLLGFNRTGDAEHDPFGQAPEATASAQREKYPVGWLVIVEGPGVGHSFSIFAGASMIGRGEDQVIRLDFGDNSISRHNHAAIAYDEEQNKFYIGHGGKSNIIRRNARPVLSTEELHHADLIRIGETTVRFVALCGSDFQWNISGIASVDGV